MDKWGHESFKNSLDPIFIGMNLNNVQWVVVSKYINYPLGHRGKKGWTITNL